MSDADQQVESSALRLAFVQRLTRSGYWEHDLRTGTNWWSDEVYRILGLEPGERPPGQATVDSLVLPEDVPGLQAAYERSVVSGRLEDHVFRVRGADGEMRHILVTGEVERGPGSEPSRFYGVLIDVTDKYRAEESARESRERYRDIVETTSEWIWEVDSSARHTFSNPAVVSILGYTPEEFLELDTFDLIHEDDREDVREGFARALERKEGWSGWVIRWRHADGSYHHLESNARPILDAGGEIVGFRGADRDITERRRMHERMLHAQKMEAVGQLAAGVAHDFNNQLVSILGHSELLLGEVASDLTEHVEEIRRAGERSAALTRELLAFGRKQVLQKTVFDLSELIDDLGLLLGRLIEENVDVELSLCDGPLTVEADRSQLECTVANLVTNARDAMPQGGTLTIRTEPVRVDAEEATARGLIAPGRFALLTVRDDGHGMDRATLARIFEPFFTTKPVGQGSGLGLATVYGIVKQSGGEIRVQSEPGRGTEVNVYLPCTEKGLEELTSEPGELPGGSEHILVLDDEPAVASTLAEVLRRAGYAVASAPGGSQALDLAAAQHFDLLITDAVMPKMGGVEVAHAMRERAPGLKVLLISGYYGAQRDGRALDGIAYLQKPFASRDFLARVRQLLDS